MAVKASEDGYGFEQVSPDVFVRREIKAGQPVPPNLFKDEEGKEPFDTEAGEHRSPDWVPYAHQTDDDGSLIDEHAPKVAAYEPPLKEGEEVTGQSRDEADAEQTAQPGFKEGRESGPAKPMPTQQPKPSKTAPE